MKAALDAAALDAAQELVAGLEQFAQLAGDRPRYYFVPEYSLRDCMLAASGEPADPPQVFSIPGPSRSQRTLADLDPGSGQSRGDSRS